MRYTNVLADRTNGCAYMLQCSVCLYNVCIMAPLYYSYIILLSNDVKSPRPNWPRGQNFRPRRRNNYNYNYNYKVSLFSKLFSEESCSVVGLSEQMSFQLGSELLATNVR